jgi:hypothetical protein
VSGGNRSERGAETQQILSSIVQTARLRELDPRDVLVDLLRSPQLIGGCDRGVQSDSRAPDCRIDPVYLALP